MGQYRFRIREVIAGILFTAVYVAVEWLEQYLIGAGYWSANILDWLRLRILISTIAGALYGPAVALICGLGGSMLVDKLFFGQIIYIEVAIHGMYAFIIGRFAYRYGVKDGMFNKMAIVDFNVTQLFANLICSMMIVPLVMFLTGGIDLYESIVLGGKNAFGAVIVVGIFGTLILKLISLVCAKVGKSFIL